jgi:hypothetical protein
LSQSLRLNFAIGPLHTDQHKYPALDGADALATNAHAGANHALQ